MIDLKELIKAGVYFGHRTSSWSPKMKPYIWGERGNIYLIDVSKTAQQLEKASRFLEQVVLDGKSVLWIGTKKPAQNIVKEIGERLGDSYVAHRWIGGTLTNYSQVKKSVARLLHYQDILEKSEQFPYTKKELNSFQKIITCLKRNIGGIVNLSWPIGAIVLVDTAKEYSALREALLEKIPVVALVDTNADPSMIDYVIPCNDDSPRSIKVVLEYLEKAVDKGKKKAGKIAQAKEELSEGELLAEPLIIDEEEDEEAVALKVRKKAEKKMSKLEEAEEESDSGKKAKKEQKKTERVKKEDEELAIHPEEIEKEEKASKEESIESKKATKKAEPVQSEEPVKGKKAVADEEPKPTKKEPKSEAKSTPKDTETKSKKTTK